MYCAAVSDMKYHLAHATSITEPFEGQFDIGASPFHGRFHVFKHSKADEMKASIAEVNVTSPERIMCGHFLLCYCCLLLSQQSRCQIHLICRYCLESHHFLQLQELLAVRKLKRRLAAQLTASGAVDVVE